VHYSGNPAVPAKTRRGVAPTREFLVTVTVHTKTINLAVTPTSPSATSMTDRPAVVIQ
jgi:hypothetical protein